VAMTVAAPDKDYRCPGCHALLFSGLLIGTIKCPNSRCGRVTRFDFTEQKRILFLQLCTELAAKA
jgi:hypothetical protein